jgi:hypothetical protein
MTGLMDVAGGLANVCETTKKKVKGTWGGVRKKKKKNVCTMGKNKQRINY